MDDLISRQAAIDALEEYLEEYDGLDERGLHSEKWCAMSEAKMAIEALPSAQPEVPDINVGDIISRQAAIDELTENKEMINAVLDSLTLDYNTRRNQEQRRGQINEDIETIKALPSAHPGIIRCKDCKYQDENWRRVSVRWLPCMDVRTGSNWYCGSAERGEQ